MKGKIIRKPPAAGTWKFNPVTREWTGFYCPYIPIVYPKKVCAND